MGHPDGYWNTDDLTLLFSQWEEFSPPLVTAENQHPSNGPGENQGDDKDDAGPPQEYRAESNSLPEIFDTTMVETTGRTIPQLFPNDSHYLCTCPNFKPLHNEDFDLYAQEYYTQCLGASPHALAQLSNPKLARKILEYANQRIKSEKGHDATFRVWKPDVPKRTRLSESTWQETKFDDISDNPGKIAKALERVMRSFRKKVSENQTAPAPRVSTTAPQDHSDMDEEATAASSQPNSQMPNSIQVEISPSTIPGGGVLPLPLALPARMDPGIHDALGNQIDEVALGATDRSFRPIPSVDITTATAHPVSPPTVANAEDPRGGKRSRGSKNYVTSISTSDGEESETMCDLAAATVKKFVRQYRKPLYQKYLAELEDHYHRNHTVGESPVEWATRIYTVLRDDRLNASSLRLNECRGECLDLVYELMNDWEEWNAQGRPSEVFEAAVMKHSTRPLIRILRLCVAMDRAQCLYSMYEMSSTQSTPPCGIPWFNKRQLDPNGVFAREYPQEYSKFKDYFDHYNGYKQNGKSTMNKYLFRLLFNETFQNSIMSLVSHDEVTYFRRLSMPSEVPR